MSVEQREHTKTLCPYCGHSLGVVITPGEPPVGESSVSEGTKENPSLPVVEPKYLDLVPNAAYPPLTQYSADNFIDDVDGTHTDGDVLNEEMLEEDVDACANGLEAHSLVSGRDTGWVVKYFVQKVKELVAKKGYSQEQIENLRERFRIRPEMGMFNVDPVDGTTKSLAPNDHLMLNQGVRYILASLFSRIDDLPKTKRGEKWYQIWDANGVARWFTDDDLELADYYSEISKPVPPIPFCSWAEDKRGMAGGEIHRWINPATGKKEVRFKLTDPEVIAATEIVKNAIKLHKFEKFVRSFNVPTCMNLEALRPDGTPYCKATAALDLFEETRFIFRRSKEEHEAHTLFRGDGTADWTLAMYLNSPIVFVGDSDTIEPLDKVTDPEQKSQSGKVIAKSKKGVKGSKVTRESTHLCRLARERSGT